jgi:hypothetical protein
MNTATPPAINKTPTPIIAPTNSVVVTPAVATTNVIAGRATSEKSRYFVTDTAQ